MPIIKTPRTYRPECSSKPFPVVSTEIAFPHAICPYCKRWVKLKSIDDKYIQLRRHKK